MRIESPSPEPYEVDDYDFTFASGIVLPFSVAKELGDTVDFDSNPLAVRFSFAAKPSQMDPDVHTKEEDVTILMSHVIMVAHRTRMITPQTREAADLFKQTFLPASKTLQ